MDNNRFANIKNGPGGTRTPDFLSAIDIGDLSVMSTDYLWWYMFFTITKYGDHKVQEVHNFLAVLPVLHP
jgi:hypothetical protein